MKKVVKVSIGNLAFTIDEDGYELLKAYLGELNAHYKSKQNGDEIIEGIEERMAELFIEKSGKEAVVSMDVVKEVVNILGRPEIIDEETGNSNYEPSQDRGPRTTQKRVFRNPDNKVFGGVCSGLATYFNIDTVLVRILFVVFFLGFSLLGFHFGGGSFMIVTYIVLWLVIPEAKTVEQRCAMHGESADLSHIQRRVEDGLNQVGGTIKRAGAQSGAVIGDIIKKVVGAFLLIFSVSGILFLTFLLLGAEIVEGVLPVDVIDYIHLGINNPVWLKIFFLLFMFLPLMGMLYSGIQLLFGFKSPRFRPGLIIFLFWIVSGVSLAFFSVKASRPYWNGARDSNSISLRSDIDTLYLRCESPERMPDSKVFFDLDKSGMELFWVDGDRNNHNIVAFPQVKIVRQSESDSSMIYIESHSLACTYAEALIKAEKNPPTVELKDSLLIIHADTYNKANKWSGTCKEISICIPERVKVILEKPVRHDFDSDFEHRESWRWGHRHYHGWYWHDEWN